MSTMFALVPLFLVGALAAPSVLDKTEDGREYVAPVPAKPSGIQEFPSMVSLHNADGPVCAGSIVDQLHVLTTGRCGRLLEGAKSTVRSGSSYAPSGGQVHNIVNVTVHPSYQPRTFDYDVAVVTITSAVPFKQSDFVQITKTGQQLSSYQPLNIYGWGNLRENSNLSVEVQPALERGECNRILSGSFSSVKLVTERMLCTLIEPRFPKTSNYGSPVSSASADRRQQVAIASWSRNRPDDICTVYTDLSNKEIQDFISASL